jgi:hypothetical protein
MGCACSQASKAAGPFAIFLRIFAILACTWPAGVGRGGAARTSCWAVGAGRPATASDSPRTRCGRPLAPRQRCCVLRKPPLRRPSAPHLLHAHCQLRRVQQQHLCREQLSAGRQLGVTGGMARVVWRACLRGRAGGWVQLFAAGGKRGGGGPTRPSAPHQAPQNPP